MNCQEALDKLYELIDNEASDLDGKQIRQHLKDCKDCDGVYRLEQAVDELLRARLEKTTPTPCVTTLKAKVLKRLDEIDCE